MRDNDRNDDDILEDLYRHNRRQGQIFEDLFNKLPSAPILKHTTQVPNDPQQGMFVVDPRDAEIETKPGWCYYYRDTWYCLIPRDPVHAIKIFDDTRANKVREGAFKFNVEKDLDNHLISFVEGANGTPGTGATTFTVRNMTRSLTILSSSVSIPSAAYHSADGTGLINDGGPANMPNNLVFHKERIWIDTLAVGAGSKGLHAYMTFTPFELVEL